MRKKIYISLFLFSNLTLNAVCNYEEISKNQNILMNNQSYYGIPLQQFNSQFINEGYKNQENYAKQAVDSNYNSLPIKTTEINLMSDENQQTLNQQENIDETKQLIIQEFLNLNNQLINLNQQIGSKNLMHCDKKLLEQRRKNVKKNLKIVKKQKKICAKDQESYYKFIGLKSYEKFKIFKNIFLKKESKELKTNKKINSKEKEIILNNLSKYPSINILAQPINYDKLPSQQKSLGLPIVRQDINSFNVEEFCNNYVKMSKKEKIQEKKFANYNYKYFIYYPGGSAMQIRTNTIIKSEILKNLYTIMAKYGQISLLGTCL